MKNLWRLLTSRYFFCAVVILLELVLLVTVYWYACIMFAPLYFVATISSIVVFLYVINHYESPDLKLPWLVIILAFGVVGAFLFVILTSNERLKKTVDRFKLASQKTARFLPKTDLKFLRKKDADAYVQAKYITEASNLPAYMSSANKTTYLKSGEEFWQTMLEDLEKAKKFIFLEFFILEPGEMWGSVVEVLRRKIAEGVEVYLMYDDFGCINRLPRGFNRSLQNIGVQVLVANQIQPVLSRAYNNRDHRKIVVIDNKVSYTGGANLADEYVNKKERFGHWKDSAIRIEGPATASFTACFIEFWNAGTPVGLDPKKFLSTKSSTKKTLARANSGLVVPYADGPHAFYAEEVAKNTYLNLINSAREYLYITTPYLICDYEIMDALALAAKKGVDVRILVPHIPDKKVIFWMTRSSYEILLESGVKVYEYTPGFIHAKNVVIDDKYATCGTINFDYRSLVHHFECGIWLYKDPSIKAIKADFLMTIKKSAPVTVGKTHLNLWQRLTAEVLKIFSPLM